MNKIKLFIESQKGKDILIILIVILVGLCSFGLGRLSKQSSNQGIKIQYNDQEATVLGALSPNEPNTVQIPANLKVPPIDAKNPKGEYFASSRGKKYYSINCSAGKTIKIENRIYFATSAEAERAGYELSGSCSN